jgi:hypothetical protein
MQSLHGKAQSVLQKFSGFFSSTRFSPLNITVRYSYNITEILSKVT